jgi:hypothetical protein
MVMVGRVRVCYDFFCGLSGEFSLGAQMVQIYLLYIYLLHAMLTALSCILITIP